MKKLTICIILFLSAFVLTACGEPKTELDVLKKYLEDSHFYKCKNNSCTKKESSGNVTTTSEYNFDTSTYTSQSTTGNGNLNTSKIEYNWVSNKMTLENQTLGVTINAIYDFTSKTYNCQTPSDTTEDISNECENLKITMETAKDKVLQSFTNSGSNYYIAP